MFDFWTEASLSWGSRGTCHIHWTRNLAILAAPTNNKCLPCTNVYTWVSTSCHNKVQVTCTLANPHRLGPRPRVAYLCATASVA